MTTTYDDPQLRDGPPPGPDVPPLTEGFPPWAQEHSATDRELLDRMLACKVAQNQAHAARLDGVVCLVDAEDVNGEAPEGERRPANLEDVFVLLTGEKVE